MLTECFKFARIIELYHRAAYINILLEPGDRDVEYRHLPGHKEMQQYQENQTLWKGPLINSIVFTDNGNGLEISSVENKYTKVMVTIPMRR